MNANRLLVTGSRDWTDADRVRDELAAYWHSAQPATVTLVHGAHHSGLDAIARDLWTSRGLPEDPHPAKWDESPGNRYAAGPLRNKAMVELGADFCIAFVSPCTSRRCKRPEPHGSHGALGCAKLAIAANIPTKVIQVGW